MVKDLQCKLHASKDTIFFYNEFCFSNRISRNGRKRCMITIAKIFGNGIFDEKLYNLFVQNINIYPKIAFLA